MEKNKHAQEMVKLRWAGTTPEYRRRHTSMMGYKGAKVRWERVRKAREDARQAELDRAGKVEFKLQ